MEKYRVAIIGAGIGGLLACKYTLSRGKGFIDPIVFESQDQVGGVWLNHTIETTRLQTPKQIYQFSDFPWPSNVTDDFPHSKQVLEYIQSYAQHFQLLKYVKFNSRVISLDYVGDDEETAPKLWGGVGKAFGSKGKWNLRVHETKQGSVKEYEADFVILCIGRFSDLPDIPNQFPDGHGPEAFSGSKVMHIMDYSAMENADAAQLIRGKRIAIIGSRKSAVDLAFECASVNGPDNPCTMVQRTIHWMLPNARPWGFSLGSMFTTRFSELMVHRPGEGFLSSILANILSPLRWIISKLIESHVRWKLPLKKYGMIPKEDLIKEASACRFFLLPEKFYDKVEEGSIVLKKSQNFYFCKEGLMLDGENDPLSCDIVFFATGYKGYDQKLRDIFANPVLRKSIAGCGSTTAPLYRQMIHPRIPQLAVIGYAESYSHLYTIEMQCQWLSLLLDRTIELPSIKEMEEDVRDWEEHMKRNAGNYGKFRANCVSHVHIWFNDQLCKDIRCNPRRKKGLFANLLEPHSIKDYIGLNPEF